MFCPKCGTEHPDDSQFCRKCGNTIGTASTTPTAAPLKPETKKKPLVRAPFAILGVLVVIFLIYAYNASQHSNPNSNVSTIDQLTKQQHMETAANPALVVGPLSFYSYKFDVPQGASSVLIHGDFTASGGLGNDIEVLFLSETDLVNWRNGHPAKAFYSSGKVTTGNLNVNIPAIAGTYYLVFNNRFSLLAQKSVRVNAVMTYYQ